MPDVVALSGRAQAIWANAIRDRSFQVFDTKADLIAGVVSPQVGQMGVVQTGTGFGVYQYCGATDGWQQPWNMPWGFLGAANVTANQGGITTVVDLTNLFVTLTLVANRYYNVVVTGNITSSLGSDTIDVALCDSGNAILQHQWVACPNGIATQPAPISFSYATSTPAVAGSYTWKLRAFRVAGSGAVNTVASATQPFLLTVYDTGPSGAPS